MSSTNISDGGKSPHSAERTIGVVPKWFDLKSFGQDGLAYICVYIYIYAATTQVVLNHECEESSTVLLFDT
jgi:hypothetical protein